MRLRIRYMPINGRSIKKTDKQTKGIAIHPSAELKYRAIGIAKNATFFDILQQDFIPLWRYSDHCSNDAGLCYRRGYSSIPPTCGKRWNSKSCGRTAQLSAWLFILELFIAWWRVEVATQPRSAAMCFNRQRVESQRRIASLLRVHDRGTAASMCRSGIEPYVWGQRHSGRLGHASFDRRQFELVHRPADDGQLSWPVARSRHVARCRRAGSSAVWRQTVLPIFPMFVAADADWQSRRQCGLCLDVPVTFDWSSDGGGISNSRRTVLAVRCLLPLGWELSVFAIVCLPVDEFHRWRVRRWCNDQSSIPATVISTVVGSEIRRWQNDMLLW